MNSKTPLVSIITPTYNHAKYIGACIESVKAQTFTNWELIIIDDGSTDATYDIAKTYAETDSRIHLIHQKNIGIFRLSETYNKALHLSKGDFIAILEGDDYWVSEKLEWQVDVMNNNHSIVMAWGKAAARVDFQEEIYQLHPLNASKNLNYYFNQPRGNIFNILFEDFLLPLTFLIRKDSLLKIGGFIQVLPFPSVDMSTVVKLSQLGKFHFSDQVLGTWRIFPDQTTKTLTNDILEGGTKVVSEHFKSLSSEEKSILRFDEKFILTNYKKRKIITFARGGRFKLIRRDFKGARKDYLYALRIYGFIQPIWKLRAFTGLIFSFLHLDVEKLAALFGKGSLK